MKYSKLLEDQESGNYGSTSDTTALDPKNVLGLNDVNYTVSDWVGPWWKGGWLRERRKKKVLKNISLWFQSGQITAILGSSGSGKTSLLDVISCRAEGKVTGKVCFRGQEVTRSLMKACSSYVMQADRLSPHLTVRETLTYIALLKLSGTRTKADLVTKVHQVILEMGLRNVADSRVGGSIQRGISGGEKRRLTIALQLIQDPDILLLDEPTTGLDSTTARHLMTSLADMAHRGKTVVLTLHQPRSDIYRLLDQIVIMSLGEIAYFGNSQGIVPYFTNLGFPCSTFTNPLDRYVDVSSVDRRTRDMEKQTTERVQNIIKIFSHHRRETENAQPSSNHKEVISKPNTGAGTLLTLWVLLSRMHTILWRDKSSFFMRLSMLPNFFLFILLFLGYLEKNQASVQDRAGLIYQCILVPLWAGIINVIGLFPSIREVYYRESRDGLYSSTTFLLAYALHVLPFCVLAGAIFSSLVYWVCEMYPDAARFGEFLSVVCMLHYTGELLTVILLGVYLDPQLANSTVALITTATTIMSTGVIRTMSELPDPLQWLSWATVQKYASEVVAANEFHNLTLTCDDVTRGEPCVYPNGDAYLASFFPDAVGNESRNLGVTVAFLCGFFIIGCVTFRVRGIPNLQ